MAVLQINSGDAAHSRGLLDVMISRVRISRDFLKSHRFWSLTTYGLDSGSYGRIR